MNNIINKYDLFIFDLDNTIINTEQFHYRAWLKTIRDLLKNENFNISFSYFCEKFHSKDSENIKKYLKNNLEINIDDENYEKIIVEKNINYLSEIKLNISNINLIDGFDLFIDLLIKNNKKFIILTNCFKNSIDFLLDIFPILKNSTKNYYREIFKYKKPDPECYYKILEDFPNDRKVCFEYSIMGIHASSNVNNIDTIFINNNSYLYYNYIIKNYKNIIPIENYNKLNNYFIEDKIVNTLRILSVDMVEKANSGHPGMPLGCAPLIYVLFCKIMNYNSSDPEWLLRDRFVLSNGHGCALLYSILYLTGYNYTMEDLQSFRQLHSKTPGHPEYNPLLGIETSTGPLGQGIANGVGMAIASKKMNIENNIYVLCGDGCLMEGVSYEACSLAGHLGLNNLVLLYDDNGITIDGTTDITFTENVRERFTAFQWNVLEIENGDNDIDDIYNKISMARSSITKPTIIFVKTTIGFGSHNSGTSSAHGTPLGKKNIIDLKKKFGFDSDKSFEIDDDVKKHFTNLKSSHILKYEEMNNKYNTKHKNIDEINLSIKDTVQKISEIKNGEKSFATRDISNTFLNIISKNIENIIVGSADLAESNKTFIESDFIKRGSFSGKYLHYGIREHAMTSIANGISTYDIIPVVSTFLVFITYCLAPIRMAALSKHRVIYVFTHDSFLLGEDGPTHQPIESLSILRSIPNLLTIRPCDTNEVSGAYQVALENNGPTALILTRQSIPNIKNSCSNGLKSGGYTVYECDGIPELIIIATGSEVSLALDVIKEIGDGLKIRLVSMPCCELFDKQDSEYKESILPKNITKISIEAGGTNLWYKYADYTYGIDRFGESGKMNDLKEYFGFTIQKCKAFILDKI